MTPGRTDTRARTNAARAETELRQVALATSLSIGVLPALPRVRTDAVAHSQRNAQRRDERLRCRRHIELQCDETQPPLRHAVNLKRIDMVRKAKRREGCFTFTP